MKKSLYFFFGFFALTQTLLSQDYNEPNPSPAPKSTSKITQFLWQQGTFPAITRTIQPEELERFYDLSNEEGYLRTNAPRSSLINVARSSGFSVGIGLRGNEKFQYGIKPEWRLSAFFSSTSLASYGANNEEYTPFDTLTSSQTADVIYVDSVVTRNWELMINQATVGLRADYIGTLQAGSLWQFYAGVGLSTGFIVSTNSNFFYSEFSYAAARDNDLISYNFGRSNADDDRSYEKGRRNSSGFIGTVNFPMGVNFQLGKKREFWKRMGLNFEFNPFVSAGSISELGTTFNSGTTFLGGIRVKI